VADADAGLLHGLRKAVREITPRTVFEQESNSDRAGCGPPPRLGDMAKRRMGGLPIEENEDLGVRRWGLVLQG
jgi:hypothetical protein